MEHSDSEEEPGLTQEQMDKLAQLQVHNMAKSYCYSYLGIEVCLIERHPLYPFRFVDLTSEYCYCCL